MRSATVSFTRRTLITRTKLAGSWGVTRERVITALMANVDDFWRQLNAKKANKASLSGLSDIPGLTTYSRTLPSKSGNGAASATAVAAAHPPAPATTQVAAALPDQQGLQVHCTMVQTAKVTSLRQFMLQANIQRDINCLKDQDRSLRRNAVSHAAATHRLLVYRIAIGAAMIVLMVCR